MSPDPQLVCHAKQYAQLCAEPTILKRYLGEGQDGTVFETTRYTAIKACNSHHVYHNEKEAYLHLQNRGCVEKIGEFHIPSIKGWHDELLVVEMDYMTRPLTSSTSENRNCSMTRSSPSKRAWTTRTADGNCSSTIGQGSRSCSPTSSLSSSITSTQNRATLCSRTRSTTTNDAVL